MTTVLPITSTASEHSNYIAYDLLPTQPMPAIATTVTTRANRTAQKRSIGLWLPVLLVVFALLNMGDLASTYLGLVHGLNEGNPVMHALLLHFGFGALIFYKVVVIAAVTEGSLLLHNMGRRMAYFTTIGCDALLLLVVVANLTQFFLVR